MSMYDRFRDFNHIRVHNERRKYEIGEERMPVIIRSHSEYSSIIFNSVICWSKTVSLKDTKTRFDASLSIFRFLY